MKNKITLFGKDLNVPSWIPVPKWAQQFLQFVVIGFLNTFFDLIIFMSLSYATGINKGIMVAGFKAVSFSIISFFSFLANKRWTFKEKTEKIDKEAAKYTQFMVITLGGLLINSGVVYLVANFISPITIPIINFQLNQDLWLVFSSLVATAFSLVWNFVGYKFIVFKK